ncbi:MAG: MBL fold metallo-hydrolase [Gemmatimonadota bacterium]
MLRTTALGLLASAILPVGAAGQANPADTVTITTVPVTPGLSMLVGPGGNILVSVGADGVFVIDDELVQLSKRTTAAIAAISDRPVRFLVNTHWHGDHTGGNEALGSTGAVIVAHANVRKRLSVDQFMERFKQTVPALPHVALPVITFDSTVWLHLNGDSILVQHLSNAHTDGDAVVRFLKANVVHMGDTYMNHMYPFIDIFSGGSIDGVIRAVDAMLPFVDERTKIIPGHGALSNRQEMIAYRDILKTIRGRVARMIDQGKTLEQIVAAKPTAEWDEGWTTSFVNGTQLVRFIHESLLASRKMRGKPRQAH